MNTLNVDDVIRRLLQAGRREPGTTAQLDVSEITALCHISREVFLSQPMLLELVAPINVCGDVHGQYHDLLRIFQCGGFPPDANYLFLGDYVDRGRNSLETICLLLSYKVKYPDNFFLLRGNHESADINRMYGFYDECKKRYNIKLWKTFVDCFNCLPVAAIVEDKIFCCHGGLSPELISMDQIRSIARPVEVPSSGLMCDLLWSDPDSNPVGIAWQTSSLSFPQLDGYTTNVDRLEYLDDDSLLDDVFIDEIPTNELRANDNDIGLPPDKAMLGNRWNWGINERGVSYTFGPEVVGKFLSDNRLDLICRAHQVVEDGYQFFANRGLVTVFSASNYCGEFDNAGAMMVVDESLLCSFKIFRPFSEKTIKSFQRSFLHLASPRFRRRSIHNK